MKRLLHTLLVFCLSMIISVTDFSASAQRNQTRGRQSHTPTRTTPSGGKTHQTKPQTARPGNNHTTKPETVRPGNNVRPGNSGRPEGTRPGNPGNSNPGNNPGYRPDGNRPGGNHGNAGNGHRPDGPRPGGNSHGPGPGVRPTPPPHANPGWNNLHWGRPPRPMCPPPAPFHRPTPPPVHYAYYNGFPTFRSILGVTIGTAINLSINALLNSGYNVTGYGNDAVYLSNVSQLSYNWPDATLYFNNGNLAASEFIYSTVYSDMGRYNNLFGRLISTYGNPYSSVPFSAGGASATWWGPGGQFITLKYAPRYTVNGALRYFTTLSFGV